MKVNIELSIRSLFLLTWASDNLFEAVAELGATENLDHINEIREKVRSASEWLNEIMAELQA